MARMLVLGLGNPLLGDDGFGWRVAERVRGLVDETIAEVDCSDQGGLSLMERMVGYERAVLVDSLSTGRRAPGTLLHCRLSDLADPAAGHTASAHDMTLNTALELGRRLGIAIPEPEVIGVEIDRTYEISEDISPDVAAALQKTVDLVLQAVAEDPDGLQARTIRRAKCAT